MIRIKELRKEKNLTLLNVANALNTSHQVISRYELEQTQPDFETLIRIADYFGVTLDYLLGRTEERTTDKTPIFLDIPTLKQIKEEKGFTYKEISSLSGVPLRTIEDMFAGITKPRIDTVEAIEKALGIEWKSPQTPKTPKFTVISNKTDFELSKEEKALILTLRRSNNAKAYIRAMITMLGETRTIDQILSK